MPKLTKLVMTSNVYRVHDAKQCRYPQKILERYVKLKKC